MMLVRQGFAGHGGDPGRRRRPWAARRRSAREPQEPAPARLRQATDALFTQRHPGAWPLSSAPKEAFAGGHGGRTLFSEDGDPARVPAALSAIAHHASDDAGAGVAVGDDANAAHVDGEAAVHSRKRPLRGELVH